MVVLCEKVMYNTPYTKETCAKKKYKRQSELKKTPQKNKLNLKGENLTMAKQSETLQKQWIKHVKAWNKEKFGKSECLGCYNIKPLADIQEFILKCINENVTYDVLDNMPSIKTYSSKGMTELQHILYLIEETDKLLFDSCCGIFTSVIFDEYNIEYGVEGLLEIIDNYIEWKDLNNSKKLMA